MLTNQENLNLDKKKWYIKLVALSLCIFFAFLIIACLVASYFFRNKDVTEGTSTKSTEINMVISSFALQIANIIFSIVALNDNSYFLRKLSFILICMMTLMSLVSLILNIISLVYITDYNSKNQSVANNGGTNYIIGAALAVAFSVIQLIIYLFVVYKSEIFTAMKRVLN